MTRPRLRPLRIVSGAAILAALVAVPAAAFLDETVYVSSGATDDGVGPHLSVDGSVVVFASSAANLAPDQDNAVRNVFVRDLRTGATELISRGTGGGQAANDDSYETSISSDGRRVAFGSSATSIHSADGDGGSDIYVRDRVTGQTVLVSRASGESGAKGDRPSFQSSISPDGSTVAFASNAENMTPADADGGFADIFVRDVESPFTTTLVSGPPPDVASDARCQTARPRLDEFCGYGNSFWPAVARGGNIVAFESQAMKLVAGLPEGSRDSDVFVRDVANGVTTAVSVTPSGAFGNGASTRPVISDDGRFVVFVSTAGNLVSGDGNGVADVFMRDLLTGTTSMVSRSQTGVPGNAASYNPDVSTDGRFVTYESDASNLAGGASGVRDVFLWDRDTRVTRLVSRATGADGVAGNGASTDPGISNNGAVVAFQSTAANLSAQDGDGTKSVFVRDLLGVPRPPVTEPPGPTTDPPTSPLPGVIVGTPRLIGATVTGRYTGRRLRGGAVVVRIRAAAFGRVTVRVVRGRRTVARRAVAVRPGADVVRLALPAATLPGALNVTISDGAGVIASRGVFLAGPLRGILSRFTVRRSRTTLSARAVFASRPRVGVAIRFREPSGRVATYPVGPVQVASRLYGFRAGLPRGRYVVSLLVGGRRVAARPVSVR